MAWIPDAFTGGLAGAVVTFFGTWVVRHFDEKKKQKQELSSLAKALQQDIDNLSESFESLYSEAAELIDQRLEFKLRVFKYIEPTSFALKYKLEDAMDPEDYRSLIGLQYTLKEIRESNEELILSPPGDPATEHWTTVQNFLADLGEMRKKLQPLR